MSGAPLSLAAPANLVKRVSASLSLILALDRSLACTSFLPSFLTEDRNQEESRGRKENVSHLLLLLLLASLSLALTCDRLFPLS